jgi:hypothetical protein
MVGHRDGGGHERLPITLPADAARDLRRLRPPPRIEPGVIVAPAQVDPTGRAGPTPNQARGPRWRQTSKGFYVPSDAVFDQPDQRIVEAATRLPDPGGVTGWACLHLAGARWFDGTDADGEALPVPLSLGPDGKRRPIPGTTLWREQILPWEIEIRRGIPCTSIEAAVFDELRRVYSLRRAVQVIEMAMFAELTSLARFSSYVLTRNRRRWVGLARSALALAQEGAESPQETLMRLVWVLDAELPPPLCNVNVYSIDGTFLGRPDLLDPVAGVVGEYDGAHHRLARVRARDVSREELFRRHGLEYFTVVEGDLARRQMVAARMEHARARALRSREPRRWTLTPPPGVALPLSLDRRIELRELVAATVARFYSAG